jgi:hypothetical protein
MLRLEYGMEDPIETQVEERDAKTPLLPDEAIN